MPKELRTFIPVVKYFNDDDSEMNEEQISSYLKEKEAINKKRDEEQQKRIELQNYKNSIKGQIEDLRKEISLKDKELVNLIGLEKLFPDIKKHQGKYKFWQLSESVNSKVTDFEWYHDYDNSFSGEDSTVTIYPYLVTEYGRVYSDPFCFILGRLEDIIINDSWKKFLIKAGISEQLISLIEDRIKIEQENNNE
jgi:hypothetical protein